MENFFIYFLKSSGLLAAFWLCFRIFLKRETFFQHHRVYLLFGVFTSFLLPLYQLKKIIFVEPQPLQNLNFFIASDSAPIVEESINWFQVFFVIYALGVTLLSFRFIIQLVSLKRLLRKCEMAKDGKYTIATTAETVNPFSFFNTIVYNPKMYDDAAIKAILIHEKVHVDQKHSIDSIIANLLCIVQWINPFAWWYKKDIVQNLEFIADKNSVALLENKRDYQYLLLHQSGQYQPKTTIINPFFNSLIKKRIVMLNQSKSKQFNLIKYALITPLLAAFLIFFNTKTVAQVKETASTSTDQNFQINLSQIEISVDKNSSDENLTIDAKYVLDKTDVDLKFSKIKRNTLGEIIAIKATYKSENGQSGTYNIASDDPIEPFNFSVVMNKDKTIKAIGFKQNSIEDQNSFVFSTDVDSNETESTSSFQTVTTNTITIDSDNIENDSIFKNIDVSTIKKININKNKNGKGGKIEIEINEKNHPNPLVIIDGKEASPGFNLDTVDPDNIASINVLKDASAISKYGEKAQNGVIEIITKKK